MDKFEEREIPSREPDKVSVLPNGDTVKFWAEEHIYAVNDVYCICMSDALVGTEIKADISESGVSEEYLKQCADFGTMFHKQIEDFIKEGKEPLIKTPAFKFFKEKIFPLCVEWHSETIVYNGYLVGTCDLWGITENGTVIVIDIKTGRIYSDLCAWQETGYGEGLMYSKYIPSDRHIDYFIFSAKNEAENCELLPIAPKTDSELENFRIAIENKCKYISPFEIVDIESYIPVDYPKGKDGFLRDYLNHKLHNAEFEKFEEAIKESTECSEKPSILVNFPIGYFAYKNVSVTRTSFDSALFKKRCPKMYKKYEVTKTQNQVRFGRKPLLESDLEAYKKKEV